MAESSFRGKLYHFFFSRFLLTITAPSRRSGGERSIFTFVVAADSVEEVAYDYYNDQQNHKGHDGAWAVEYHAVGKLT